MKKQLLFHWENAPAHSRLCSRSVKTDSTKVQDHAASTVFASFPSLGLQAVAETQNLPGWKYIFLSSEEVKETGNSFLGDLEESHFRDGIERLEKRWTMYVQLRGGLGRKLMCNLNRIYIVFVFITETFQSTFSMSQYIKRTYAKAYQICRQNILSDCFFPSRSTKESTWKQGSYL